MAIAGAIQPCPFCGSTGARTHTLSRVEQRVACQTCGAQGPTRGDSRSARIAWNVRPAPAALNAIRVDCGQCGGTGETDNGDHLCIGCGGHGNKLVTRRIDTAAGHGSLT